MQLSNNNYVNVNDFFCKFIKIDHELNLLVEVKYFTKKCDYKLLSNYIFTLINFVIEEKTKTKNENVIDVFCDIKDYNIKEIDYDFIKLMIGICQKNYKDNLRVIYIKNANIMFKTIYAVVRPFIDKVTRKKILFVKKKSNDKITEDNIDELFS